MNEGLHESHDREPLSNIKNLNSSKSSAHMKDKGKAPIHDTISGRNLYEQEYNYDSETTSGEYHDQLGTI